MAEPTRNLLILHTPGLQALSDWEEVQRLMAERAPDIEVRIATNGQPSSVTRRWQVSRPSLVLCPNPIRGYRPMGGKVYGGNRLNKIVEVRMLTAAGLPVPQWRVMEPGIELDPAEWGEFVIAKPDARLQGKGVRLIRTRDAARQYPLLTARGDRYIVQKYVDNRDENGMQTEHRVAMILGKPLYAQGRRGLVPRRPLEEIADEPEGTTILGQEQEKERFFFDHPDVLALAERTAEVMRQFPVLGVDILRERSTGSLYVLETNAGGGVWHLSSSYTAARNTPEVREARYKQFDALSVAANQLIERTRAEAM